MDGTVPAFDAKRWHRQFAAAQLNDYLNDALSPEVGPADVRAAMRDVPQSTFEVGAAGAPSGPPVVGPKPGAAARRYHLLEGAPGVPSWQVGDSEQVDIYLSAGPNVGTPGSPGHNSCDFEHVGNCQIFRVRWDLAAMRAVSVDRVIGARELGVSPGCTGGIGAIQPALSRTKRYLAWTRACVQPSGPALSQEVQVTDLTTGATRSIPNPTGDKQAYPEWLDDEELFFDAGSLAAPGTTVFRHNTATGTTAAVVGPLSAAGGGDAQNPRIHPFAGVTTHGTSTEPRLVVFGGNNPKKVPREMNLAGTDGRTFDLADPTDPTFYECHHPAWNPDGTAIMCTRQSMSVPKLGYNEEELYRFVRSSGFSTGWVKDSVMFTTPSAAGLEARMGTDSAGMTLFPAAGSPFCRTRVWKYAQWCQDERYLIATLFCGDTKVYPGLAGVFVSRIVLIDTDTNQIFDVTAAVEAKFPGGRYHGIFATCGTPGCLRSSPS